ncbi:Uncharacterised protein [Vibrio cholerae]|nr:Uncharacterised protein [Vibrio cholerae]
MELQHQALHSEISSIPVVCRIALLWLRLN